MAETHTDTTTDTAAAQTADLLARSQASAKAAERAGAAFKKASETSAETVALERKKASVPYSYLQDTKPQFGANRPTVSDDFRKDAYRENLLQAKGIGAIQKTTKGEAAAPVNGVSESPAVSYRQSTGLRQKLKPKKTQVRVKTTLARVNATRITVGLLMLGWPLYLVQVIFAILGLVAMGLMGAMDALTQPTTSWYAKLAQLAAQGINAVLVWVGFDLAGVATGLFGVSLVVTFAIGLFSIFITYGAYVTGGIHSLFGRDGAGLKVGMLLLSIIGYCVPGLNLFPMILLWMGAVWIHPR